MQKRLTNQDRKKIKKKLWFMAALVLCFIGIFSAIYFFALRDSFQETDGFGYIPLIIFGVFGLFFIGVIAYMISIFVTDLSAGVKDCFEGIIEDKRLDIKQSTSRTGSSGVRSSSGRKTNTKRYYYITIDGIEHKIEYAMYRNVKVGDTVYFEIAPKSHVILFYEVLKSAASISSSVIDRSKRSNYPDSRIRQAPLTRKDKNAIRAFYDTKMRSRLFVAGLLGAVVFGLIYNGLLIFVLFLFPIPIIVLVQVYKAVVLYFNFKKSIDSGRKQLISTEVTDKLFTTISNSKGKHEKNTITTSYKVISVPENVYQDINIGDEIIVHEASHLSIITGITLEDVYYEF
ncbi:hypothetical protein [Kordia sp.]|uniref:hypothetical protein n=1 Tax=Kordia sp. TaxID=1965332 RepID=UPI003D6B8BB5